MTLKVFLRNPNHRHKSNEKKKVAYGGISEMSVLEPPPGTVGFTSVVSTEGYMHEYEC